jgi:hypothetical protein
MLMLLGCGAALTLLASGWTWQHAWTVTNSGIHEILAAILLLIAATLLTGIGIIQAIEDGYRRLAAHVPPAAPQPVTAPDPAPQPPSPPGPALQARATLFEALTTALQTLSPAERAEADGYVQRLAHAGYPEVIRHRAGWEIMTPGGRIAATVRPLDELRQAAQRLVA